MRRGHLTSIVGALGVMAAALAGAVAAPPSALATMRTPAAASAPSPTSISGAIAAAGSTPVTAAGSTPVAGAERLPDGWAATPRADGRIDLTWTSATDLPVTDAGLSVYAGTRRLGAATVAGRTASIVLDALPAAPQTLVVRAGATTAAAAAAALAGSPASRPGYRPGLTSALVPNPQFPADLPQRRTQLTASADYTLPDLTVAGYDVPMEMSAHVVAPIRGGAHPLVVILHGRHEWCYGGGNEPTTYPCSGDAKAVPSQLGYLYLQRALASRGYATISVDLNGVNAQDGDVSDGGAEARSQIVRAHLRAAAAWQANPSSAPAAIRAMARWDLRRVVLVGHSRGGEGADRAAVDVQVADPFRIAGLVLWAPVNFARQTAAATPTVTLLPGCDGDVSDLQGQAYADRSLDAGAGAALHTSVYVPGANHNFLNTEWTPGISVAPSFDDGQWTRCATAARQTPAQERTAGAAYTLAALRTVLDKDAAASRYLDGSTTLATGVGTARARAVPVGGARSVLWRGNGAGTPRATVLSGRVCLGQPGASQCPGGGSQGSPHWLVADARVASAAALRFGAANTFAGLRWSTPVDASARSHLEARVIVPPLTTTTWQVRLTDAAGHIAVLTPVVGGQLAGLPTAVVDDGSDRYLGQLLRVSLAQAVAGGVDVARLAAFELVDRSGPRTVTLLDVSSASTGVAGYPATAPEPLPRMDLAPTVQRLTEGSVDRVVTVPLRLTRPLTSPAAVRVLRMSSNGKSELTTLHVPAGVSSAAVPMPVSGNTLDDDDEVTYGVWLEPHAMVGIGESMAVVVIEDDDDSPVMTATPSATASEGGVLTWTVSLSRASNREIYVWLEARTTTAELRGSDLPTSGWADWGLWGEDRLLSAYPASRTASIPVGTTSTSITLPIRADSVTEGTERARFAVSTSQAILAAGTEVTGSVRD